MTTSLRIAALAATLAFLSACAPAALERGPSGPPPPRLPGMTSSAIVTLAGEPVYYESGGQGSPVVLVHGIGAGNSSHLYRRNTAALAAEHRVYAFDLPGFGRSPAREGAYTNDLYVAVLRDFLRDVVREPTAVIGGSLGADYAIRVAAEDPALVTKLILSNPTGYGDVNGPPDANRFRLFTSTPVGFLAFETIKSDDGLNFFLYNTVYLDPKLVTPDVTRLYRENLQGPDRQYPVFSFFAGYLSQRVDALWPRTTQPALLVWGLEDVFTPVEESRAFVRARPVPLVVLRARAIPYEEAAGEFNDAALNFLR